MSTRRRKKSQARPRTAGGSALFDDFLPYLITRLAHQLDGDLVEKLRRENINVTRWRIVAVLAMGDGITVSEITDRAMLHQSALSRALMTMEREGYLRRAARRGDGRYVEVFITRKGRALFDALEVIVRRREEHLLKGLSRRQVDGAFTLIRRLSRNMSED